MIEDQNELVKDEIKNRDIKYKNVKLDMDKAIDMLNTSIKQSDVTIKNQFENNNIADKQ